LPGAVPERHGLQALMPVRGAILLSPLQGWQASGSAGVRTPPDHDDTSPFVQNVTAARGKVALARGCSFRPAMQAGGVEGGTLEAADRRHPIESSAPGQS
jgi:hypothetical protein